MYRIPLPRHSSASHLISPHGCRTIPGHFYEPVALDLLRIYSSCCSVIAPGQTDRAVVECSGSEMVVWCVYSSHDLQMAQLYPAQDRPVMFRKGRDQNNSFR